MQKTGELDSVVGVSREGNEWEAVLGNESSSQWSKSYVWIEWEEAKDNWPKFRTRQSNWIKHNV